MPARGVPERVAMLEVSSRTLLHMQVLSALLRGQRARDARLGQRHEVFHRQDVDTHQTITAGDGQIARRQED